MGVWKMHLSCNGRYQSRTRLVLDDKCMEPFTAPPQKAETSELPHSELHCKKDWDDKDWLLLVWKMKQGLSETASVKPWLYRLRVANSLIPSLFAVNTETTKTRSYQLERVSVLRWNRGYNARYEPRTRLVLDVECISFLKTRHTW